MAAIGGSRHRACDEQSGPPFDWSPGGLAVTRLGDPAAGPEVWAGGISEQRASAGGDAGTRPECEEDPPTARGAAELGARAGGGQGPAPAAPIVPGTVGSLDDVPIDAADAPVIVEEE